MDIRNLLNVMDSAYTINWKISLLVDLYLCALCFLCYGHAWRGTYVFDDRVAILENKVVTQTPLNITALILNDFWGTPLVKNTSHKSFRPLTTLMFHMEYAFGFTAAYMKLINICIHAVNTMLVWHVMQKLLSSDGNVLDMQSSLLTATIFAVHPIHTEAVCGIVSRADLMCALMYFLSITFAAGVSNCLLKVLVVIFLTTVGMLFKETAITIPIACILIEYIKQNCYQSNWRNQLNQIFKGTNIFYFFFMVNMGVFRMWWSGFQNPKFQEVDNPAAFAEIWQTRVLSQNYIYVKNILMMLDTTQLSFDWAFGCIKLVKNFTDFRVMLILLFYFILIIALINHRKNFAPIFGISFYIIAFLPASGIVKVGFVIAERILYIPSMGYCYLVAVGFRQLLKTMKNFRKTILFFKSCLIFAIIILIARCRQRAKDWLTEENLFTSALKVCPNNAKVHYNIARLASGQQNYSIAFSHYHKAIELYPKYDAAYMNLGNLYREIGNLRKAEEYLIKCTETRPDFATAWMNLGIVYANAGNYNQSLLCYERALMLNKNYPNCHYNLGNMYLEQKIFNKALMHWKKAVALNPYFHKAWINILTLLDFQSRFNEVLEVSEYALVLHPTNIAIMMVRANVFGKLENYKEAEAIYKNAISKEPLNYLCHTNLGVLYHRWQKLSEAIKCYKKAIACNPKKATTARENLNKLIHLYKI